MKKQSNIKQYGKPTKNFSNKVQTLSFVMSILVIAIHANNLKYYGLEEDVTSFAYQEVYIISQVIGNIAVPFFFMMSGYWFFRMDIYSNLVWKKVRDKLKKKIRTLIIPYFLWNMFGMVFYMTITRIPLLANQMNGGEIVSLTFRNILEGIVFHKFYFPFWYMRDLILIAFVLSPLIVLVLRNIIMTYVVLGILISLSIFDINFNWLNTSSILMFYIGGILVVYFSKIFEKKQNRNVTFCCMIILLLCCVLRYFNLPILSKVCLYISPFLMWCAFDFFEFRRTNWFYSQSFFIYASHIIPVTTIAHLLKRCGEGQRLAALTYFLSIGITLVFLYMVANVLNRIAPRLYGVICGNR